VSGAPADARDRYVALSGGVGGAKLVLGLSRALPADALTVVVNTGDDFEHLGMSISPDLDTVMYTLAGEVDEATGWGCRGETWQFMAALERLGGETWFRLGDRDLATHVRRSRMLVRGATLSEVTAALCRRLGVAQRIVPMSDAAVRTRVITDAGRLEFQQYFVRDRAGPRVSRIEYDGAAQAQPAAAALEALRDPRLAGIIIAPSNPYLSVDPMLAIPGLRQSIVAAPAPVIAVSPIVGGAALKGPTAKIMRELGREVSARAVAAHYGELLDGFIVDMADREAAAALADGGVAVAVRQTVMRSLDDKIALAEAALTFAASLA
jgi:LPPG:FO 2-phospho-L-lactate transferase